MGALIETLHFQHVAPTAPDTLGCRPFTTADPFAIGECPHVYFAANQPAFDSRLVRGPDGQTTRAILVPDFGRTQTCVLVNLTTLDCQPVNFGGLSNA